MQIGSAQEAHSEFAIVSFISEAAGTTRKSSVTFVPLEGGTNAVAEVGRHRVSDTESRFFWTGKPLNDFVQVNETELERLDVVLPNLASDRNHAKHRHTLCCDRLSLIMKRLRRNGTHPADRPQKPRSRVSEQV